MPPLAETAILVIAAVAFVFLAMAVINPKEREE